jgi:signal recognition particle receptor subunit beta
MAKVSREAAEVNARIVYWGIEGSGKTANLRAAFAKLRPDHRGEIRELPSRLDPTVSYEILPISLGEIAGIHTQIEMIAVPGNAEQAPIRKQLLDRVDGIVLVLDATPDKLDENVASFDELRQALGAYGRSFADVALVVQYNKRDLADPYALEDLHRKLAPGNAPIFEAVASDGTGVLQTLSTISKRVIRGLREQNLNVGGAPVRPPEPEPALAEQDFAAAPEPELPAAEQDFAELPEPEPPLAEQDFAAEPEQELPVAEQDFAAEPERMENAIAGEPSHSEAPVLDAATRQAETLLDSPSWPQVTGEIERPTGVRLGPDVSIVSVGEASRADDRSVRVPLVLGDAEGGTTSLVLTLRLDVLVDEDPG